MHRLGRILYKYDHNDDFYRHPGSHHPHDNHSQPSITPRAQNCRYSSSFARWDVSIYCTPSFYPYSPALVDIYIC